MLRKSISPARPIGAAWPKARRSPCTLLVATAATGSSPASISAGTLSNPPPPAIASMMEATKATAISTSTVAEGDRKREMNASISPD
jgi:hypothetical protein